MDGLNREEVKQLFQYLIRIGRKNCMDEFKEIDATLVFRYESVIGGVKCRCELDNNSIKFFIDTNEFVKVLPSKDIIMEICKLHEAIEYLSSLKLDGVSINGSEDGIIVEYTLTEINSSILQNKFYSLDQLLYSCSYDPQRVMNEIK